jgi:hypothetical protein
MKGAASGDRNGLARKVADLAAIVGGICDRSVEGWIPGLGSIDAAISAMA